MPEIPTKPTRKQVKHYKRVVKPQIEKAVKKLSKKQLERAAELGGEIAIAELARREERLPIIKGIEPTVVGIEPTTPSVRAERKRLGYKL